jgi:hypothetical protein
MKPFQLLKGFGRGHWTRRLLAAVLPVATDVGVVFISHGESLLPLKVGATIMLGVCALPSKIRG